MYSFHEVRKMQPQQREELVSKLFEQNERFIRLLGSKEAVGPRQLAEDCALELMGLTREELKDEKTRQDILQKAERGARFLLHPDRFAEKSPIQEKAERLFPLLKEAFEVLEKFSPTRKSEDIYHYESDADKYPSYLKPSIKDPWNPELNLKTDITTIWDKKSNNGWAFAIKNAKTIKLRKYRDVRRIQFDHLTENVLKLEDQRGKDTAPKPKQVVDRNQCFEVVDVLAEEAFVYFFVKGLIVHRPDGFDGDQIPLLLASCIPEFKNPLLRLKLLSSTIYLKKYVDKETVHKFRGNTEPVEFLISLLELAPLDLLQKNPPIFDKLLEGCMLAILWAEHPDYNKYSGDEKERLEKTTLAKVITELKHQNFLAYLTPDALFKLAEVDETFSYSLLDDPELLRSLRSTTPHDTSISEAWFKYIKIRLGKLNIEPDDYTLVRQLLLNDPIVTRSLNPARVEAVLQRYSNLPEWVRTSARSSQSSPVEKRFSSEPLCNLTLEQLYGLQTVASWGKTDTENNNKVQDLSPELLTWLREFLVPDIWSKDSSINKVALKKWKLNLYQTLTALRKERVLNGEASHGELDALNALHRALDSGEDSDSLRKLSGDEDSDSFRTLISPDLRKPMLTLIENFVQFLRTSDPTLQRIGLPGYNPSTSTAVAVSSFEHAKLQLEAIKEQFQRLGAMKQYEDQLEQLITGLRYMLANKYVCNLNKYLLGISELSDEFWLPDPDFKKRILGEPVYFVSILTSASTETIFGLLYLNKISSPPEIYEICKLLDSPALFVRVAERVFPGLPLVLHGKDISSWDEIQHAIHTIQLWREQCNKANMPVPLTFGATHLIDEGTPQVGNYKIQPDANDEESNTYRVRQDKQLDLPAPKTIEQGKVAKALSLKAAPDVDLADAKARAIECQQRQEFTLALPGSSTNSTTVLSLESVSATSSAVKNAAAVTKGSPAQLYEVSRGAERQLKQQQSLEKQIAISLRVDLKGSEYTRTFIDFEISDPALKGKIFRALESKGLGCHDEPINKQRFTLLVGKKKIPNEGYSGYSLLETLDVIQAVLIEEQKESNRVKVDLQLFDEYMSSLKQNAVRMYVYQQKHSKPKRADYKGLVVWVEDDEPVELGERKFCEDKLRERLNSFSRAITGEDILKINNANIALPPINPAGVNHSRDRDNSSEKQITIGLEFHPDYPKGLDWDVTQVKFEIPSRNLRARLRHKLSKRDLEMKDPEIKKGSVAQPFTFYLFVNKKPERAKTTAGHSLLETLVIVQEIIVQIGEKEKLSVAIEPLETNGYMEKLRKSFGNIYKYQRAQAAGPEREDYKGVIDPKPGNPDEGEFHEQVLCDAWEKLGQSVHAVIASNFAIPVNINNNNNDKALAPVAVAKSGTVATVSGDFFLRLSRDIQFPILCFLPTSQLFFMRGVNKQWKELAERWIAKIIKQRLGVRSDASLEECVQALNSRSDVERYQGGVLYIAKVFQNAFARSRNYLWTLEEIERIQSMAPIDRFDELIKPRIDSAKKYNETAITRLRKRAQAQNPYAPSQEVIVALECIVALFDELITIDQVVTMSAGDLKQLLERQTPQALAVEDVFRHVLKWEQEALQRERAKQQPPEPGPANSGGARRTLDEKQVAVGLQFHPNQSQYPGVTLISFEIADLNLREHIFAALEKKFRELAKQSFEYADDIIEQGFCIFIKKEKNRDNILGYSLLEALDIVQKVLVAHRKVEEFNAIFKPLDDGGYRNKLRDDAVATYISQKYSSPYQAFVIPDEGEEGHLANDGDVPCQEFCERADYEGLVIPRDGNEDDLEFHEEVLHESWNRLSQAVSTGQEILAKRTAPTASISLVSGGGAQANQKKQIIIGLKLHPDKEELGTTLVDFVISDTTLRKKIFNKLCAKGCEVKGNPEARRDFSILVNKKTGQHPNRVPGDHPGYSLLEALDIVQEVLVEIGNTETLDVVFKPLDGNYLNPFKGEELGKIYKLQLNYSRLDYEGLIASKDGRPDEIEFREQVLRDKWESLPSAVEQAKLAAANAQPPDPIVPAPFQPQPAAAPPAKLVIKNGIFNSHQSQALTGGAMMTVGLLGSGALAGAVYMGAVTITAISTGSIAGVIALLLLALVAWGLQKLINNTCGSGNSQLSSLPAR